MKNLNYLMFLFLFSLLSCSSDDSKSSVMKWTGTNDVSDFTIYVGAPSGGKEFVIEKVDSVGKPVNVDSVRNALVVKYLGERYSPSLYKSMTVEFNDDIVTYVDSMFYRKTISTYQFKEDSLFVNRSDGKLGYVATGNMDSLYRLQSISRYILTSSNRDTVLVYNEILTLDKVLKQAGYSSLKAMTNNKDTIIWCNIKSIFK